MLEPTLAEPGEPDEQEAPDEGEGVDEETLAVLDCLDGKWEIDKTSDLWDLPYGDADVSRGTIYMYFDPVSGFMLEYDDVYVQIEVAEISEHEVEVTADGASLGTYDVDDDGYVTTVITDPGIEATGAIYSMFGDDVGEGQVVGEFVEMVYSCDGETLTGYSALTGDLEEPVAVYHLVERIMGK